MTYGLLETHCSEQILQENFWLSTSSVRLQIDDLKTQWKRYYVLFRQITWVWSWQKASRRYQISADWKIVRQHLRQRIMKKHEYSELQLELTQLQEYLSRHIRLFKLIALRKTSRRGGSFLSVIRKFIWKTRGLDKYWERKKNKDSEVAFSIILFNIIPIACNWFFCSLCLSTARLHEFSIWGTAYVTKFTRPEEWWRRLVNHTKEGLLLNDPTSSALFFLIVLIRVWRQDFGNISDAISAKKYWQTGNTVEDSGMISSAQRNLSQRQEEESNKEKQVWQRISQRFKKIEHELRSIGNT